MTQVFCVSPPQYEVCLITHICNHITCLLSECILLQTRLVVLFPPFFLVKLPERAGCFTEKIKDIVLNTLIYRADQCDPVTSSHWTY